MDHAAIVAVVALVGAYGCGHKTEDRARADSPAVDTAVRVDTTSGDWAITDPERQFLRLMADHHAGMTALARIAQERAADTAVRADARRLAARHAAEGAEMLALLRQRHRDAHRAMTTPSAQAMADSLRQTSPAAVGRAFAEAAAAHLREDLAVIDRYLPSLDEAPVNALAQRLREEQARELAEMERITTPPVAPR